jgi:hypothetical protein
MVLNGVNLKVPRGVPRSRVCHFNLANEYEVQKEYINTHDY